MEGPGIARLEAMLDEAVVILVVTRDDDLQPHVARAWGGLLDAEAGRLDLAVTVHDDVRVVADLKANGSVAVLVGRPSTYQTMQITGHAERVGTPGPADLERINVHVERFVAEGMTLGLPKSVARLAGERWVSIRVALDQFFEQTPGQKAGSAL